MDKTSEQKTIVTLLLDRSASMMRIRDTTIAGVNAWLEELRKTKDNMLFSLIQFDHYSDPEDMPKSEHAPAGAVKAGAFLGGAIGAAGYRGAFRGASNYNMQLAKTYMATPISDVRDLTKDDYSPRGGTPLIDAAFTTIRAIEESVKGRDDIKIVLAIQTDGEERDSKENTWDSLKVLVAEKEAAGWEILFMGVGMDAYAEAAKMGVSRDKTLSYGGDAVATRAAFASTAGKTVAFSSGVAASMAYTDAEKLAAGDTQS